ncbi:hypothetical protein TUBRATIS_14950 [Tubulinosema ratisbonensis]|uniref:Uncharacterized protein n=1 Tax=Tubulinosema ratisbonensis TaxID=291195 RepID=A0A437ALD9_9MICR|nr:hypothetical protein TUBRATIS_14950 [Tubulinosema ratisbonensis]
MRRRNSYEERMTRPLSSLFGNRFAGNNNRQTPQRTLFNHLRNDREGMDRNDPEESNLNTCENISNTPSVLKNSELKSELPHNTKEEPIFKQLKIISFVFILYCKRIFIILCLFLRCIRYFSSYNSLKHFFTIREYFNIMVYSSCAELNLIISKIDKQRKKVKIPRPYDLPSSKLSFLGRLFNLNFYKINKKTFFYLLDTQLSLQALMFYKMDLLFLIIFLLKYEFIFYILLSVSDLQFLLLYLNLKKKEIFFIWTNMVVKFFTYRNLKDFLFKHVLFLALISRDLINFKDYKDYFPLSWFLIFLNVYLHSLDVYKLQSTFIQAKIHLLFSPGTFILFYYCYMFISLLPFYLIYSLCCNSYDPLVSCFVFIFFIGTLSTLVKQPIISISVGLISCLLVHFVESTNLSFVKILEVTFLPCCTKILIKRMNFSSLIIWLINLFVCFVINVYKLSRMFNKVE